MDDNRPKRRKSKDNPYTLYTEDKKFYMSFVDVNNNLPINSDFSSFLQL